MVHKLARQSPLDANDRQALLDLPHQVAIVERGSYLVREGDASQSCILLLSGFVYRSKVAGSGARQILSIHLQGDLVDLHNSVLASSDHSVQALTQAKVAHIPHAAILGLARTHPAIGRALWQDTAIDGSIFREWLLNVGRRDARQRVSHLLCELAVRQEAAGLCRGPEYEWPMTQEQIGDASGLTTVHVNRTLQALRSEGLISTSKRTVSILNWAALQAAGDFSRGYLHQPRLAAA
jgi:CRP-like cAMP-binding protein